MTHHHRRRNSRYYAADDEQGYSYGGSYGGALVHGYGDVSIYPKSPPERASSALPSPAPAYGQPVTSGYPYGVAASAVSQPGLAQPQPAFPQVMSSQPPTPAIPAIRWSQTPSELQQPLSSLPPQAQTYWGTAPPGVPPESERWPQQSFPAYQQAGQPQPLYQTHAPYQQVSSQTSAPWMTATAPPLPALQAPPGTLAGHGFVVIDGVAYESCQPLPGAQQQQQLQQQAAPPQQQSNGMVKIGDQWYAPAGQQAPASVPQNQAYPQAHTLSYGVQHSQQPSQRPQPQQTYPPYQPPHAQQPVQTQPLFPQHVGAFGVGSAPPAATPAPGPVSHNQMPVQTVSPHPLAAAQHPYANDQPAASHPSVLGAQQTHVVASPPPAELSASSHPAKAPSPVPPTAASKAPPPKQKMPPNDHEEDEGYRSDDAFEAKSADPKKPKSENAKSVKATGRDDDEAYDEGEDPWDESPAPTPSPPPTPEHKHKRRSKGDIDKKDDDKKGKHNKHHSHYHHNSKAARSRRDHTGGRGDDDDDDDGRRGRSRTESGRAREARARSRASSMSSRSASRSRRDEDEHRARRADDRARSRRDEGGRHETRARRERSTSRHGSTRVMRSISKEPAVRRREPDRENDYDYGPVRPSGPRVRKRSLSETLTRGFSNMILRTPQTPVREQTSRQQRDYQPSMPADDWQYDYEETGYERGAKLQRAVTEPPARPPSRGYLDLQKVNKIANWSQNVVESDAPTRSRPAPAAAPTRAPMLRPAYPMHMPSAPAAPTLRSAMKAGRTGNENAAAEMRNLVASPPLVRPIAEPPRYGEHTYDDNVTDVSSAVFEARTVNQNARDLYGDRHSASPRY